jgi:hypothetical protein
MNCGSYGWSKFMPPDQAQMRDGTIDTGMYFIEIDNYFPLKGDGWYFDDTVEKAIKFNIIKSGNMQYQLQASYVLPQHNFK